MEKPFKPISVYITCLTQSLPCAYSGIDLTFRLQCGTTTYSCLAERDVSLLFIIEKSAVRLTFRRDQSIFGAR